MAKKSDWPNCIFMADLRNLDISHEIEEVKRLIRKNKAPNGWTVGPSSFPENLGKLLEENSFSNVYHQSAMALNLKDLEFNKSDLKEFKVKLIKSEKDIDIWAKVVSAGFNIKVDINFLQQFFHDPKASFYIGIFEAEPVSSLLMFNSSGVSGLHAVSTLSDYRGRGFGVKISGYALLDAFDKGFKMAVLHASDLGFKVYQKLGFKKYGDIYSYELI